MKRSKFNLTHDKITSMRMGLLTPFLCQEVIPGDSFKMQTTALVRALPMLAPIMTPIQVKWHFWYCPYRILDNFMGRQGIWENFIVNMESSDQSLPSVSNLASVKGDFTDHIGVFSGNSAAYRLLAYPYAAYGLIWNEFYRDEDLQDEVSVTFDGKLTTNISWKTTQQGVTGDVIPLLPVSWQKDRFTTARPWTQKGDQVFAPIYEVQSGVDLETEYTGYRFELAAIVLSNNTEVTTNLVTGYYIDGASLNGILNWFNSNLSNATISSTLGGAALTTFSGLNIGDYIYYVPSATYTATGYSGATSANNSCTLTSGTFTIKGIKLKVSQKQIGYKFASGVSPTGGKLTSALGVAQMPYYKAYSHSSGGTIRSCKMVEVTSSNASPLLGTAPTAKTIVGAFYSEGVSGSYSAQGSLAIRDLRLASALQKFNENRSKWGSRYNEYLQFLGVRPSDGRLQLPEYLGGGKQYLNISEVLQTAPSDTSGSVGTMTGHGVTAQKTSKVKRFFEEHGVVLGLMYIQPKLIYASGCPRFLMKRTPLDFFQRDLAGIGAQEVYTQELYGGFTWSDVDQTVFGYQDRYDEYRSGRSFISGDMHDTLDFWHMARKFDNFPALNANFLKSDNATMRVFADLQSDPFIALIRNNIVAKRPIPKRAQTRLS